MWLERGEHVCLVGANGSGKTTLLETLVGEREPDGAKLRARSQRQARLPLPAPGGRRRARRHPAVATRSDATGLSEAKTRALLGRFLFSGDDVAKRLADISGGEAQRLALALLTQSDANVLVLDEPTNHLDLESREALEDALTGFAGSLLLVSHDRALLEAVGSRTLVIEDRSAAQPPGRLGRIPLLGRAGAGDERRRRPRAEARPPAPPRGREQEPQGRPGAARARGREGRGRLQAARG